MSSQRSFDHNARIQYPLPKIGQTRCYWAMLSADLQFIYLDPVLQSHLEDQAESLLGRSLLSFVHPDEQASAKQDLGGVLNNRTLHGSVTRVRFSRLDNVRRQLGYDGPQHSWAEAEKIALDKDYMAVDIVINWAAEGLVLCFLHAIVDLSPGDNDETQKTDWTNWCGTPYMPNSQIEALWRALLMFIPQPGNMSRVFQILSTQRDRPLLISWPPDSVQGPNSRDFARLVDNVHIGADVTSGNDAKTSCTRRYKSSQGIPQVLGGEVESIFIPHGTVTFACHKVNSILRGTANSSAPMQQLAYTSPNYNAQQNSSYYEQGGSYALPPLSPQSQSYHNNIIAHHQGPGIQPSYPSQRWTQGPVQSSNLRSGSYPSPSGSSTNQTWQQGQSASYLDTGSAPTFNRPPLSPPYTDYSPTTASSAGPSPTSEIVPPPRHRISPGLSRDQPGSGRAAGNRPTGVQKCSSCKATSSPEWRKGPSGKKELCNACGLRYARSRAKKEGTTPAQQRRRRKEKSSKRNSPIPPTSTSVYSAIRRNYPESSFSTSPAGSASGSDIYSHSSHHILDNLTPSPSPPASMNFVHYAPSGPDSRPSYSGPQTSGFYNIPSPLSNPTVLHPHDQQPQQSLNSNQLPPLGELSSYADRLSSPTSHSSLTTTLPASSYERERERERDPREPPTPLSAQPRVPRRSILTQQ